MPQYNKSEIGAVAKEYGFVRDTFEKVLRLKEILRFFNEQEVLRDHLLLKGGTAINLTVFNLPRLSVTLIPTLRFWNWQKYISLPRPV